MTTTRKTARTPVTDLVFLQREIDQLFTRLAGIDRSDRVTAGEWSPDIDVYECNGNLLIVAEVPGVGPDSLRVVCRNRQIVISGERRNDVAPEGLAGYLCMERPRGRFTRSIPLNLPVDVQKAEARLEDGLLRITIPRLKERHGREIVIPIKTEDADD